MLLTVFKSPLRCQTKSPLFLTKVQRAYKLLRKNMSTENPPTPPVEAQANFQRKKREQKQKVVKKPTPKNYSPGTVNLQVLGTGSNGAPPSVYLFTDQSRYLFNCGEGTQRLAHEHKTKLSRLERIFVTRNTWPMIGGIPGLSLTVQDAGVQDLTLMGPPYLDSILKSMERFVALRSLKMTTVDATQLSEIDDAVMTVKCVPIYRTDNDNEHDKVVIAYHCKLKPRPCALSLEKCVARGLKPGPLLGMLKNGMDVTLEDGSIVKSSEVSEPPEAPLSFTILDIPTEEFLPELQRKISEISDESLALVVHFSPAEIVENNCYNDLLQKLPTQVEHLYLNAKYNNFSGFIAAQRLQYHLHQLNPRIFPLLAESTKLSKNMKNSMQKKAKLEEQTDGSAELVNVSENVKTEGVNSLTCFHLRPFKGFDRSTEAKFNPAEYIEETQALEDFPAQLEKLKQHMFRLAIPEDETIYPRITFLGTGSCVPNKTRNVSAILLQTAADAYVLLDCGEGTLGQIVRFFGETQAEEVIRNLRAIYVSHLHADHHIGLIGILHERQRLMIDQSKILIFAPRQIEPWLNFYNTKIAGVADAYELVRNSDMLEHPLRLAEEYPHVQLDSIQTCLVRHCPHSFGVRLTLNKEITLTAEPVTVTYSGDTMPCRDLVQLGHKTTILIHEATMEDDLVEEARIKMHSTISEAIAQGHSMEAEHIVLTHFSQRYAKLPRMQVDEIVEEESAMRNVAIAFDNMNITLADLKNFQILYPALRALFAEHAEELEIKALKREQKMERKRKLLNEI